MGEPYMSLDTGLNGLLQSNYKLLESFTWLRGVLQDKPQGDDVVLVSIFSDSVEEIIGRAEETLRLYEGLNALAGNAGRLAELLEKCQLLYTSALSNILDLASYERLSELRRFSHKRGGEWPSWSKTVRACLRTCLETTYQFNQKIFDCCQENLARSYFFYVVTEAKPGTPGSAYQTR